MLKKLTILLIEDDLIEVMKVKRTISSFNLPHKILEAKNGDEALKYLKSDHPLPDILLLDLNMPKISGIEFLHILKDDPLLKYLPAIVLTTSANEKDILACYQIGIAGYMVKPFNFDEYLQKLKSLMDYWSHNELIKP